MRRNYIGDKYVLKIKLLPEKHYEDKSFQLQICEAMKFINSNINQLSLTPVKIHLSIYF